jgi:predicted secreted protein
MAKGDIRDVWETNRRRLERKRLMEREWAKANRDKMNAYKQATRAKKAAEMEARKVKSAYHADWHGTTYQCPELTYRRSA